MLLVHRILLSFPSMVRSLCPTLLLLLQVGPSNGILRKQNGLNFRVLHYLGTETSHRTSTIRGKPQLNTPLQRTLLIAEVCMTTTSFPVGQLPSVLGRTSGNREHFQL
ncbi:hypothetical protein TELCIR_09841 [Teladorsagia circumcincta]|uniref:Secreted protein n=1 Tax=Teladorsagia circumcincta TaxID=45464 RepID=A0A2G9UDZ6_TELCI|nr:hypothetical protein TELCIR_09841 [Teladorsagia circumcincta]